MSASWLSGPAWSQSTTSTRTAPAATAPAASSASAPGTPRLGVSVTAPSKKKDSGKKDNKLPLYFEADKLEGETDELTRASGTVRMRQGDMTLRADEVVHTQSNNTAKAKGHVRVTRQGNLFTGPEITLQLDTLQGEFISPQYWFARTNAGGKAERIDFLGENKLRAVRATYSSCTPENTADGTMGEPDWYLKTSSVYLDFDANEGRAENAVIRFLGVPILAAPVLTFPLNDQRKSGWLPPSVDYDSRRGLGIAEPYYWNIAPDMDATFTPTLSSRRGMGLGLEYRFLTEHDYGELDAFGLPDDKVAGKDRGMVDYRQKGSREYGDALTTYNLRWQRVSDDDYWKDFLRSISSTTPRLYDSHANVEHLLNAGNWGLGESQTSLFASQQNWQVLKDLSDAAITDSTITAPYNRTRMGILSRSAADSGISWSLQGKADKFTYADSSKQTGSRINLTARVEQTFNVGGLKLTPRLSVDDTHYELDPWQGSTSSTVSRTLPTASLDAQMAFERNINLFQRDLIQTLEPRIQYVRTPYQNQDNIPLFDTAARNFNQYSIWNENGYTGVDRITDANQVTLGMTSRLIDPRNGAEAMRFGIIQKVLLADQQINPDGTGPITQRLSNLLLSATSSFIPSWYVDGTVQLDPQDHTVKGSSVTTRYSPGAYRTISATYRYTTGSTAQFDVGWQWPLGGGKPTVSQMREQASSPDLLNLTGQRSSGNECGGTWYSVGRMNYDMRDGRIANGLLGVEYDAGCWISRVVVQRTAVGTGTSRSIMFQLELVGLSRLGSNPLRTLRDSIPGYRLLRDNTATVAAPAFSQQSNDD